MKTVSTCQVVLWILLLGLVPLKGAAMEKNLRAELPKRVGAWRRLDSVRFIDSKNIFEYMNGAGELYLGYGFDHLEVFEYTAENQPEISVEVYFMKSSDDAFGLLSQDWGGRPVLSEASPGNISKKGLIRALYGEGLLRIWSGDLYVRILAQRKTAESEQAVLALGKVFRPQPTHAKKPVLLKLLPDLIDSKWRKRHDRLVFFRSHLVLNASYYLSQENILLLDHSAQAVTVPYEMTQASHAGRRVQVVLVKYASAKKMRRAWARFEQLYLEEQGSRSQPAELVRIVEIEDGWVGLKGKGLYLVVAFECQDQQTAKSMMKYLKLP